MNLKGKNVFVGLSGGVDSAVAAYLLKRAGAAVTGVFIKGWYPPGMPCTWADDRRDAIRVAAHLRISFLTLDASEEYKKHVIDYLLREYQAGRTPNPDVMCNKDIKFGVFYRFAVTQGADMIATGHYRSGEKDQSYFLWAVQKDVLARTIFPVGALSKDRVRMIARRAGLPVARKKDSQGVCFLGSVSVEDFLRATFTTSTGDAIDHTGRRIGRHAGALVYTIGERVSITDGEAGPWYVIAKDLSRNLLVVGRALPHSNAYSSKITFSDKNMIDSEDTVNFAQYRYRGAKIAGHLVGDIFHVAEPLTEPVAPGQSLVFYHNNELAGGGIIC